MLKTSLIKEPETNTISCKRNIYQAFQKRNVGLNSDCFIKSKSNLTKDPAKIFSVNFKGLSRALKQQLYDSDYDIAQLLKKYPKSKGIIGSPPAQWINAILVEDKEQKIKQLYSGFKKVSNVLAIKAYDAGCYKLDKEKMHKELAPKIVLASSLLKGLLDDIGFDTGDLKLGFVGLGFNGAVYKFNIAEKDYVIKVYHIDHEKKICAKDYHGNLIEPNRAAFIKGLNKPSQYINYYFADLENGFMIADYIDEKSGGPLKVLKERLFGFFFADNKGSKAKENTLNGWNIDFGGIKIFNQLLAKNKTVRYVFSQITNNASSKEWIDNWDKLYTEVKKGSVSNKPDLILGLVAFASFLPANRKEARFNKILELTSSREISLLLENIECIPNKYRLNIVDKYLEVNSNKDAKKIVRSLSYLKADLQINILNKSCLEKDELISRLNMYPEDFRLSLIKIMSKDTSFDDEDLMRELISENSSEENHKMLKLLAKYSNREIKAAIFYGLKYLPEEMILDVLKEVIDNSDMDMKKRFLNDLIIIPENIKTDACSIIKGSFLE